MPKKPKSEAGKPPHVPTPDPDSPAPRPAPSPGFPNYNRPTNDRYTVRWPQKRADFDDFEAAWWRATQVFAEGRHANLPDSVSREWRLRWLVDLFARPLTAHDRMTDLEVAASLEDIEAVLAATRFVMRRTEYPPQPRTWLVEYPPSWYRRPFAPGGRLSELPAEAANFPRFTVDQFLGLNSRTGPMAAVLLAVPTADELDRLSRLVVCEAPDDPVSMEPAVRRVIDELRQAVRELSGRLRCPSAGISDPRLMPEEVLERVQTWLATVNRPATGITNAAPPTPETTRAGGRPGSGSELHAAPPDQSAVSPGVGLSDSTSVDRTAVSEPPPAAGSTSGTQSGLTQPPSGPDGPLGEKRFRIGGATLDLKGKTTRYRLFTALVDIKTCRPRDLPVGIEVVIRKVWPELKKTAKDKRIAIGRSRLKDLCFNLQGDFIASNVPYSIVNEGGDIFLEATNSKPRSRPEANPQLTGN